MSFLRWFAQWTPQWGLVILGLSCALIVTEIQRLPAAHVVKFSMFAPLPYVVEAFVIVALCFLVRFNFRKQLRVMQGASATVALAAIISTWLLLWPEAFGDPAMIIVRIVYRVTTGLLLVLWMLHIIDLGPWRVACLIGFSFLLSGIVVAGMATLPHAAIAIVLVLVPVVAGTTLIIVRVQSNTLTDESMNAPSENRGKMVDGDRYLKKAMRPLPSFSFSSPLDRVIALSLVGLPLICRSPMVGTQVSWMAHQDEFLVGIGMQLSIGVGTVVAALAVALIVRYAWNRSFVLILDLIVLPLSFVSFYTEQLAETLYFLHFLIVDSTYKVTLFYVMMTPFIFPIREKGSYSGVPLYLSFGFMMGMRGVFSGLHSLLSENTFGMVSVVVIALSFVAAGILTLMVVHRIIVRSSETDTSGVVAASPDVSAICERLSKRFDLTPRESEVLLLLAQNYRAPYIAEKLVVSQSTIKTHMRNLYAKLGVHSQAELQLLVDREASSLSVAQ